MKLHNQFISNSTILKSLIVLAVFLQSCVAVNITANKSSEYNKQPKSIFIVMNCNKQFNAFSESFLDGVKKRFSLKNINVDYYRRDPLSLESEDDINKKINTSNPDALFIMVQKIIHTTNGSVDGGTFEITLIDKETRKPVWKAELVISGNLGMSQDEMVSKSLDEFFKQLTTDKLY